MDIEEATSVSTHYTAYAEKYHRHYRVSLTNRVRTALERGALKRALRTLGYPQSILDLPAGTGRFWPTLAECCKGELLAADVDMSMLKVARQTVPRATASRFTGFSSSVFDIAARDDRVDTVVCMRFFHHLSRPGDRMRALQELARVARRGVIVSLWTDGSLSNWWQEYKSRKNMIARQPGYGRRVCIPASLFEWETQEAGLRVIERVDVLPRLSKWRVYVLGVSST